MVKYRLARTCKIQSYVNHQDVDDEDSANGWFFFQMISGAASLNFPPISIYNPSQFPSISIAEQLQQICRWKRVLDQHEQSRFVATETKCAPAEEHAVLCLLSHPQDASTGEGVIGGRITQNSSV